MDAKVVYGGYKSLAKLISKTLGIPMVRASLGGEIEVNERTIALTPKLPDMRIKSLRNDRAMEYIGMNKLQQMLYNNLFMPTPLKHMSTIAVLRDDYHTRGSGFDVRWADATLPLGKNPIPHVERTIEYRILAVGPRIIAAYWRKGDWQYGPWGVHNSSSGVVDEIHSLFFVEEFEAMWLSFHHSIPLWVAGVDVMVNGSGGWYVAEVNAAPGMRSIPKKAVDAVAQAVREEYGWIAS